MSSVDRPDYHVGGDHSFSHNSPRPPVPGGETEEVEGLQSPTPGPGYSTWSASRYSKGGSSPVFTPRRSSLACNTTTGGDIAGDGSAPLGFEPEGSCQGGGTFVEGSSPPSYLRWASNLHSLLDDPDGVELFRRYLEQEGESHVDTLTFWFACEGLKKQQDPERVNQLVKVIYRRFFHKTQLAIPDELRKEVNRRIKEGKELLEGDIYDDVQQEVERLINETTYPNFLRSDIYLQHVRGMQNGGELSLSSGSGSSSGSGGCSSGGSSGGGGACRAEATAGGGPLPTLHEDSELVVPGGEAALPLTKDMLIATQKRRALELRPKPEAYAGLYLQQHAHHHPPHHVPPHLAYSSYNPVSRQDSELQSLSSDARTESDNMSLTDSSVDGMSVGRARSSKKQYIRHCKQIKESASINRDPYMHYTVIPRTQRILKEQVYPMNPDDFAAILIEKLEAVKREQDAQEKLDRKLQEGDFAVRCDDVFAMDIPSVRTGGEPVREKVPTFATSRAIADTLQDKLQLDDDSDQAILDQHVLRVWSDSTPSRTPGLVSPRPHSPEGRRRATTAGQLAPLKGVLGAAIPGYVHGIPHPYQSHARASYSQRHPRKEKDVFSTFSSDSGNVHDFQEGSEYKHHMPKSKSMPDYQEAQKQDVFAVGGHDARFRQSRDPCRRSSSKKTLTDLTDSGVSVVSDTIPIAVPSTQCKDSRVLSWLMESEKQVSGVSHTHSEREAISSKHRLRTSATSATSPIASRHSRKPVQMVFSESRSGSLERTGPAQPFVADPCMPPLSLPHTATQLEEARRRLEEEARTKAGRQRFSQSSKTHGPQESYSLSAQSTLRKSGRGPRSSGPTTGAEAEYTTVVFSFCEEQFPYRTKIPGRQITLRQFKEYLPKKGSYRYFFKTECEDLDMKVIQEEIMDDNDILPLWEGKVMAQVKPVE